MSRVTRPVGIETHGEPDYPTLVDYRCERRRFLRHLAFGTISLGLGGALLTRCTSRVDLTGGPGPHPQTYTVRLPGTGSAQVYIMEGSFLTYSVTFTTRDGEFAGHFTDGPEEGPNAMYATLSGLWCSQVADGSSERPAVVEALRSALEARYAEATGSAPGDWIDSIELTVDSCEEGFIGGAVEEPPYP